MRHASTSVYASRVHRRLETLAFSSLPMDGSATFTTVASSDRMKRLRQQMSRMRFGCRYRGFGSWSLTPGG
jgi:hypothetical protein